MDLSVGDLETNELEALQCDLQRIQAIERNLELCERLQRAHLAYAGLRKDMLAQLLAGLEQREQCRSHHFRSCAFFLGATAAFLVVLWLEIDVLARFAQAPLTHCKHYKCA